VTNLSASLTLRPTRIGFLVEPQDIVSLRKIFQACACLWGGVFNPIIPVCGALPEAWKERHPAPGPSAQALANGYCRFFEPDVFVEAQKGLAQSAGIAARDLDFDRPRVIALDGFFDMDSEGENGAPFGTDVFCVYKQLYEREFKFVPRHERRVAVFEGDSAFIEASFGGFPASGRLTHVSQAYVDAFGPVKLTPTAENWLKVIREDFRLPLHFTRENLKRDPDAWYEPTLFVADPTSPLDLLDLWNIRQFHPQILPFNFAWLNEAKDFLTDFVKANYRPLPGNPHGLMMQATIQFGRSISQEQATTAIERAGLSGISDTPVKLKFGYDRIWELNRGESGVPPRRARVSASTSELELPVSEFDGDLSCRFKSLAPDFSPTYGDGSARWVNVLKFSSYGSDDTLALMLPSSFTDERGPQLRLGGAILMSREGFVLPQEYKEQGEYLQLLTGQQALIRWLGSRGIKAEPSDPGRIADQVVSSLQGLRGARLIADRDTLKLLDEMSKSVRRYADGKLEEFPDRSIDVKRWGDLVSRRQNAPFSQGISLDRFIKANVLRLGLVLECKNCRKKNWFGIEGLREQLTCERCLKLYAFPQGSLNFDRTPWQYRVIGPYSVPNYAEGAYATVLAVSVFAQSLASEQPRLTYATGLKYQIGDANPFEVDFTLWYQRTRILNLDEEPVLVFGEAKSFAVESFKQEDLARMRKLAEQFPGAFLVFAALKDDLSDTEKVEIGHLATWGRERLVDGRPRAPVIVLTGIELFAPWRIRQSWKGLGGERAKFAESQRARFDNLWDLAELTQQIYLGLPDPYAHHLAPRAAG
jgi:hypothetical protein